VDYRSIINETCGNATSCKELMIIGSQSILASLPDSPRELRSSLELDVSPIPFSEEAVALIDGNIGELSQFHKTFDVYAHGVAPNTATLPEDYKSRLVVVTIGDVTAHCLSPIDLVEAQLWSLLSRCRSSSNRCTKRPRLFAVVEDDSHGVPVAGTHTAHAMTQIHSVSALDALYGAMTDREGHSITLLKAYHLGP
jgi:hypothetical protein